MNRNLIGEWRAFEPYSKPLDDHALNLAVARIESKLDELLTMLNKPKKTITPPEFRYSPEFEQLWAIYPKRGGSNPKASAARAVTARIKERVPFSTLMAGTVAYRDFIAATGRTGSEFVMQAVRFYGRNREFEQAWAIPENLPKTDAEWLAAGLKRGISPRPGEEWNAFKSRVLA